MDYRIFEPSDKKMKQEYPELNSIEEFSSLSDKDLRFVWYFSNPTSPYMKLDRRQRVISSMDASYGNKLAQDVQRRYVAFEFPEAIKVGIERMKQFNVSERAKAKQTTENIYKNLQKISEIDIDEYRDEEGKPQMDEIKKYVDVATKVAKELPTILELIECGYGVNLSKSKQQSNVYGRNSAGNGATIADRILSEE